METVEITITRRTGDGKGAARRLRATGRVPAVLYGPKRSTTSVAVLAAEFEKKIAHLEGSHLIRLLSEGDADLHEHMVLMREIQRHPVTGDVLHADFYEVEPGIVAVVPFDGSTDNEHTARQSVELQLDYITRTGRPAGVIVFADRVTDQDTGARRVYRDLPDPSRQLGYALVYRTPFGRAVSSIFLKLSPPPCPTRLFSSVEEAKAWLRSLA